MDWHRVTSAAKLAFREDLQADPTLTDLRKRMISIIAQHWDGSKMQAECSLSFVAAGCGTTKDMVAKYKASLIASGRVKVLREATYTTSTLWAVNWWYRGSAWIRAANGGNPISDCRKESPGAAHAESPGDACGESPTGAEGSPLEMHGGVPQAGDQFPSKEGDRGAIGARPFGAARLAPKKERKDNPHKIPAGFAKWKIVHAEFEGEDEDILVAHLRSGKSRKFVVRCHLDSDDYGSLNAALNFDGDPDSLIDEFVAMSTNRTGSKEFQRAAPLPWTEATVLSGETLENGTSVMRCAFKENDGFKYEGPFRLSASDAAALFEECGGEDSVVGSRIRYRLLPDDRIEFSRIHDSNLEEAA